LPQRKLGKTGRDVCTLSLGGMMAALSPQYLDMAWSMGVRYFDTADCYLHKKSETIIAQWLAKYPQRRKELFLVSKDHPTGGPKQLLTMIDTRLKQCGTDYLDLFFIHGIGTRDYGASSLEWPKSTEFKQVCETLKKSGKCKYVGFSCHDGQAAQYLQAAADGGFIDAIMVAYSPLLAPTDAMQRSLDACHKAGIGLIAMKTMRAHSEMPKRLPEFDKLGLTTRQALLQAVLSDGRISAVCSMIENVQQMTENVGAMRSYKEPLKIAQIELLREVAQDCRPTMCPNCDGRCKEASGRRLALNDIARYVNYYEKDGNEEARDYFLELATELRDAHGADLAAAREACLCKLDFANIMRKAERYFA
jgi:aryl-alcohol dehydrogenase-like predicted oxidoreductase